MLNVAFVLLYFVFFVKKKAAYEVSISDGSSDVCSSDLDGDHPLAQRRVMPALDDNLERYVEEPPRKQRPEMIDEAVERDGAAFHIFGELPDQTGIASCRERVCQYV